MADAMHRENIYSETLGPEQFGIIEKPLTLVEKIYSQAWLRKVGIIVVLALAWEFYARWLSRRFITRLGCARSALS